MTRMISVLLAFLATGCSAYFHANGLCEIRVDGGSALSTLDSVDVAIDTALGTAGSSSILLVIQVQYDAVERVAHLPHG